MKIHRNTLIFIALLAFLGSGLLVWKLILQKTTPPPPSLKLLKINPSSGIQETPFFVSNIEFTFDSEIDSKTISYTIYPPIKTNHVSSEDQKTIQIRLQEPWKPNQEYKLIISKNLSSQIGGKLEEDIVYTYGYKPPEEYTVW